MWDDGVEKDVLQRVYNAIEQEECVAPYAYTLENEDTEEPQISSG